MTDRAGVRPCAPHGQGHSAQAAHKNAANKDCFRRGSIHGGDADRLRYPPGGGWHAHHAAALSRRSLERAGGEPRDRRPRSHLLSAEHAAVGPGRLAAGRWASRAAISRWSSAARSTSSAPATRSATCSTARRPCSIPTWRPPSARRSTTGSRPNGCRSDPRLRASIVVPMQAPDLAIEEIERRAGDNRFVSILVLAQGETLLGRRHYWPVYQARREIQAAARDPCRQPVSAGAELDRLAVAPLRILFRRGAGVPGADPEPDL